MAIINDDKYKFGDHRDCWRPTIREETCLECKHLVKQTNNPKKKAFCKITKRTGSPLRGIRCIHFEKLDEDAEKE